MFHFMHSQIHCSLFNHLVTIYAILTIRFSERKMSTDFGHQVMLDVSPLFERVFFFL